MEAFYAVPASLDLWARSSVGQSTSMALKGSRVQLSPGPNFPMV